MENKYFSIIALDVFRLLTEQSASIFSSSISLHYRGKNLCSFLEISNVLFRAKFQNHRLSVVDSVNMQQFLCLLVTIPKETVSAGSELSNVLMIGSQFSTYTFGFSLKFSMSLIFLRSITLTWKKISSPNLLGVCKALGFKNNNNVSLLKAWSRCCYNEFMPEALRQAVYLPKFERMNSALLPAVLQFENPGFVCCGAPPLRDPGN